MIRGALHKDQTYLVKHVLLTYIEHGKYFHIYLILLQIIWFNLALLYQNSETFFEAYNIVQVSLVLMYLRNEFYVYFLCKSCYSIQM